MGTRETEREREDSRIDKQASCSLHDQEVSASLTFTRKVTLKWPVYFLFLLSYTNQSENQVTAIRDLHENLAFILPLQSSARCQQGPDDTAGDPWPPRPLEAHREGLPEVPPLPLLFLS